MKKLHTIYSFLKVYKREPSAPSQLAEIFLIFARELSLLGFNGYQSPPYQEGPGCNRIPYYLCLGHSCHSNSAGTTFLPWCIQSKLLRSKSSSRKLPGNKASGTYDHSIHLTDWRSSMQPGTAVCGNLYGNFNF